MASNYHFQSAIGLDCGDSSGKAVFLSRQGSSGWRIDGLHFISRMQDGLLSAEELRSTFSQWLGQRHLEQLPAACGISQAQVNTSMADFPPVSSRAKLAQMVGYQIRQLSGISGEDFNHDFQSFLHSSATGQAQPVLMALCRASVLEEQLDYYTAAGVRVEVLTGNGLALANAFEVLQPIAAAQSRMQLILDVGRKESNAIIYCNGRLQSITVLMAGLSEGTQEEMNSLAQEVSSFLWRWQESQNRRGIAQLPAQLWLSGGGALCEGLPGVLSAALGDVPVSILGVPLRHCPANANGGPAMAGVYPTLAIAFGLALQCLGLGKIKIALTPKALSWRRERLSQRPYLLLMVLALFFSACSFIYHCYARQERQMRLLEQRTTQAREALALIPKLRDGYRLIDFHQRRMLPITELSQRCQRYISTINSWNVDVPSEEERRDWCIYLADEFSFQESNGVAQPDASSTTAAPAAIPAPIAPVASPSAPTAGIVPLGTTRTAAEPTPAQTLLPVEEMPILRAIYMAGFVPQDQSRYHGVKELQNALNNSRLFVDVDDYAVFAKGAFTADYLEPWRTFLNAHREAIGGEYTLFLLQLPFRVQAVSIPAAEGATAQ